MLRLLQIFTECSLDDLRDGRLAIYRFVVHLLIERFGETHRHNWSLLRVLLRPTPGSQRFLPRLVIRPNHRKGQKVERVGFIARLLSRATYLYGLRIS